LLPDGEGGNVEVDTGLAAFTPRKWYVTGRPAEIAQTQERPPFERTQLANGIVVLGQAQPADPTVSIRFRLQAGAVHDPADRYGLATMTARGLTRGTPNLTYEQFSELTDSLGATVSVDAGRHFAEVAVRCLKEDLHRLVEAVADFLRQPTFPDEEIEKVRAELLTTIREQENDTADVADRVLRELLYPDGHPYRHRVSGEATTVSATSRSDLVSFHEQRYGPRTLNVAAVGGFAEFGNVARLIEERFGDWSAPAAPAHSISPPSPPATLERGFRGIPGKSQSDIQLGYPTIARSHPDYYAFELANLILGRLGLFGRYGAKVRDEMGLAYYVYSSVEPGREWSVWKSSAGVNPANIDRALDSMFGEIRRLRHEPVTEEELFDAKSFLTGSLPLAIEMNDGVARLLLNIEHYDLGLDYLERYPEIINSLTREDLLLAAREHLDPDRIAVGVAGPERPS
jgi:zinc protease